MMVRSLGTAAMLFLLSSAATAATGSDLTRLVKKIRPAVVTVIAYDMQRHISGIGTGFFVNPRGHLITNFHVLAGNYAADVRTSQGNTYTVKAVLAENKSADLLKLQVDIPPGEVSWISLGDRLPEIAERIVVVGSPMGLEQTVSEGIVSSLREIPVIGPVFQMSAPISPGSSGSPVVNAKGQVLGIATFQFIQGQNLNFAVTSQQMTALKAFADPMTLSEWTFARLGSKPRVAEELCQKGFTFAIEGEDRLALEHFLKATQADPTDAEAWSGLGSCYAGMNHPEDALAAFRQAVQANPRDEVAHLRLANFLGRIGRHDEAIAGYREALAINPQFEAAYFNLGLMYVRIGRYAEGTEAFEAVTRINPDAGPAHYNAGLAYSQLGRFQEAIAAHQIVIRLNPGYAPAYQAIGAAMGHLGRPNEEIAAYREAIRVDPDFAPAHDAMGTALLKRGDTPGALAQYKILQRLDPAMAANLFNRIYPER
ncbi:MAG: tetratricopeptide repeat protein [Desulfobacterales bacterium]|jgi:tetratricopeptide (TPR) repeat protein|nr:tetratricopeptide repeat protein [Desulfobacterales bacterium]